MFIQWEHKMFSVMAQEVLYLLLAFAQAIVLVLKYSLKLPY